MLEHYVKKLCTMMAAAGLLAVGSTGCESGGNIQSSGNHLLDAQNGDSSDTDDSLTEIYFRSTEYGVPQGKDAVPETGDSNDAMDKCPVKLPCQPYISSLEDDDPILGDKCTPVSIIWFIDYQSPYDRKFWEQTLPLLKQDYILTGKVKLVLRDFPTGTYFMAEDAAEFAHCAGEQGKYWEMHDKIFSEQAVQGEGYVKFSTDDLKQWAGEIGLDVDKVSQCYYAGVYEAEIQQDYEDGEKAGVFGIPTFFINDEMLFGAYDDYAEYTTIIEKKLKEQCK